MKAKLISELTAVMAIGILIGLHSNWLHWHWHQLGREAYLAHQSSYFDEVMANPASPIHPITIFIVAALIFFAVFKSIAFLVSNTLSRFAGRTVSPGN